MSLATIQHAFLQTIYSNDSTSLQTLIHSQPNFTSQMRANVYYHNTNEALKETLHNTYPVCEAVVGKAYFSQLASQYVTQTASTTPNLNDYGDTFAQTLTTVVANEKALQSLAYLPDLARLEWLLHRSYYAKNRQHFDFDRLATLNDEQQLSIRFHLADDIQLMDSPFAVVAIWQAHQDNNFNFEHVAQQHSFIVVKRDRFMSEAVLVEEDVYRVLIAIQQGKTLLTLTELPINDVPTLLNQLIAQKWVDTYYIN